MAGFVPVEKEDGCLRSWPAANSQTIVKGDALIDNGSGLLAVATSASTEVQAVAAETVTTTSSGQLILVYDVQGIRFDAPTDANPAQTDVWTLADLATVATLNPDASSNDVFKIEEIIGGVANNLVRGRFIRKVS